MDAKAAERLELIDGSMDNKPVSRVPTGFWFHFLGEAETGDAGVDGKLLVANIEGHRRFIQAFKPDMIKIMSDGFFRYPVKKPIESLPEALSLIEVLEPGHPWIARQADLVKAVRSFDYTARRFYNVFSPATTLRFMVGRDKLASWLEEDPDAVKEALDRMASSMAVLAQEALKAGADGLYLSVQNPRVQTISDSLYDRVIKDSELKILKASQDGGGRDILHVCGYDGVRNRLGYFASYPASVISWAASVEGVPLGEGKRLFGGRAVVGGFANTPGSIIHKGSEQEIKAKAREILAESGRVGVILGADCTVPSDIDLKRLEWAREAAAQA